MDRVTNIDRNVIEKRLALTPKQGEALHGLRLAFDNVYKNGMGAKEIAVALHDIGPAVPDEVHQSQPFAFAALYFNDELFSEFMSGDAHAREEATLGGTKAISKRADDSEYAPPGTSSLHKSPSS
jgi:hypothetical protein